MSLANFQETFSRALFSGEVDPKEVAQIPHLGTSDLQLKQFIAYRSRALTGLGNLLRDVYPTVAEILGDEVFNQARDAFFLQQIPRAIDPVVFTEPFATFLDLYALKRPTPHIADMATLDFGCYKARQAIDAEAMNTRIFTDLSPEQLAARRIQLHPACFWMASPFAIYDIWRHYHVSRQGLPASPEKPQELVIIRPNIQVEVVRVDMALIRVLDALDAGETLNKALLQGNLEDPTFNAVGAIQFLIQNNLIISLY